MDIIKEWNYRLVRVNTSITDYKKILESNEITSDMKTFCYKEIEKKIKYKNLIEETLIRLNN